MSLETTIASLVTAANNLTTVVSNKMAAIDARLKSAEDAFNNWRANFSETINGLAVYKQGGIRRYFFGGNIGDGGYTLDGGPDSAFPYCLSPQPPYYINLLEFIGSTDNGFGNPGDQFKIEFIMAHRGMGSSDGYADHLVFTGTTWSDSVSGQIEVKRVSANGAVSVYVSEPNNPARLVPITKAMEGTTISVSYRGIGQNIVGSARLSLKIDSRYFCGTGRAYGADVTYTAVNGRPPANRISQTAPKWDA